jgi:glycerol-3-phosphate acyltransferase PlsY
VGASNLLRFASRRVVAPVIVFDVLKGMGMVLLAWRLGLGLTEQVLVGLAVIIGHNWPVFLRFSGGRGIITTMGVAFILPLLNQLVSLETVFMITVILNAVAWVSHFRFRKGPLGVFILVAAMPLIALWFRTPLPFILGCLGMFLILVVRRLTAWQPVKVNSMSRKEKLLNRLLFDRDVREKEVWVSLLATEQKRRDRLVSNPR